MDVYDKMCVIAHSRNPYPINYLPRDHIYQLMCGRNLAPFKTENVTKITNLKSNSEEKHSEYH